MLPRLARRPLSSFERCLRQQPPASWSHCWMFWAMCGKVACHGCLTCRCVQSQMTMCYLTHICNPSIWCFTMLVLSPALPRRSELFVRVLITPPGRLKGPGCNCGKMYGSLSEGRSGGHQGCAAQKILPKHARSIHCHPNSGLAKHGHSTILQYFPLT